MLACEVVITGMGIVSPIGIGREAFWASLSQGHSGIGPIRRFDPVHLPVGIAGEVNDFDPTPYIPRKQLKLMCRDAQLGVAAAMLACRDAALSAGAVEPERLGVVLGADTIGSTLDASESTYRPCIVDGRFEFARWGSAGMAATFPLNFLKVLPNMIASHVSIVADARGSNNTIHQAEVSGLLSVIEAARVIQRGAADVMLAGGASSQMNPYDCVRRCAMGILSRHQGHPAAAMRPFDADRDGQVWGEGAAVLVLEDRRRAEARRAPILARLLGWGGAWKAPSHNGRPGTGLGRAIQSALSAARLEPHALGHINAHGLSMVREDQTEALTLHQVVPGIPVTAPKSYFGNLGAATGAMELAASVLALAAGRVPATLNYEKPDPQCPIEVVRGQALCSPAPTALAVNWTPIGQAAAIALGAAN